LLFSWYKIDQQQAVKFSRKANSCSQKALITAKFRDRAKLIAAQLKSLVN